jgi:hypothetical protein
VNITANSRQMNIIREIGLLARGAILCGGCYRCTLKNEEKRLLSLKIHSKT